MSEDKRNELRQQGYLVIQTSWMLILIISFIVSLGIGIGVGREKITNHEMRLEILETGAKSQSAADQDKLDALNEISFNLRNICKKLNLDYIESNKQ